MKNLNSHNKLSETRTTALHPSQQATTRVLETSLVISSLTQSNQSKIQLTYQSSNNLQSSETVFSGFDSQTSQSSSMGDYQTWQNPRSKKVLTNECSKRNTQQLVQNLNVQFKNVLPETIHADVIQKKNEPKVGQSFLDNKSTRETQNYAEESDAESSIDLDDDFVIDGPNGYDSMCRNDFYELLEDGIEGKNESLCKNQENVKEERQEWVPYVKVVKKQSQEEVELGRREKQIRKNKEEMLYNLRVKYFKSKEKMQLFKELFGM